jgi:hypothetical protein
MKKFYNLTSLIFIVFFAGTLKPVNAQNINHWEMVVAATDTWQYFPGTSEPASTWNSDKTNSSSWLTGPGGIGYGDGDDGTIINAVPSVYLRTNFNLTDTSIISWAILHVDYDDAFVAYLNGHEIARANIGTAGVKPLFNTYSTADREAKVYAGGIPERFIIQRDTLRKYIIQGANILAIEVHNSNATSSDLSSITYFSVGIKNGSSTYRQVPAWFDDPLKQKTNLPLLMIDTKGQEIPDEPKITAHMKVINNGPGQLNGILDDATDYTGNIGIEIRGQSSQMFPKKSFSVELRDTAGTGISDALLGMPAGEDWALIASFSDKSLLRNAITYQLGRKMGAWQPRTRFCEVYMNGVYHGVYLLVESIKRGADRVDINKLKPDEISGDNLTGGYIVKVDKTWDLTANEYFYTWPANKYYNARNYAFTYVYPKFDEIVSQQKSYIQDYLLMLENTLNGSSFKDPDNGYRKYMDVGSFVDFQIINELTNNVDGYRYSTFFYKKKDSDGGKLFAGPLWDFDLCYGNADFAPPRDLTTNWLYPNYGPDEGYNMHWWARLMEDEEYRQAFAGRWKALRAGAFSNDSIMANVDSDIAYIGDAVSRNFNRWPIIGQYVWPNYFIGNSYQEEVDFLKAWILNRLNWMDGNVSLSSGDLVSASQGNKVLVYPNPVKDQVNIELNTKDNHQIDIEIVDLLGKRVFESSYLPGTSGIQTFQLHVPAVAPGYYLLKLKQNQQVIGLQKLVIRN